MIEKIEAIRSLVGGGITQKYNGEIIYHDEQTPPTEKVIEAKLKELQSDYDAKSYARARASQYPEIIDVVVALAEKEEGDDTMWKEITALRQKVKADNPKPE